MAGAYKNTFISAALVIVPLVYHDDSYYDYAFISRLPFTGTHMHFFHRLSLAEVKKSRPFSHDKEEWRFLFIFMEVETHITRHTAQYSRIRRAQ